MVVLRTILKTSALLALFFCVLSGLSFADSLPREDLVIVRQDGHRFAFDVEVADDDAERETGLMNRTELGLTTGMLFDFGKDRRVTMWMKNTLIPLDMLFADRDGKIVSIRQNTEPMSESLIDSRQDVHFVLEVAAGTAARLGLNPGDRLENPRIPAAKP